VPPPPADQEIGLQSAGDLLAERFGSEFKLFWALGLLAAGQVSTIALTYAGQLIMAGMLRIEVQGWKRMVCTRMVALVPALAGKCVPASTRTCTCTVTQLTRISAHLCGGSMRCALCIMPKMLRSVRTLAFGCSC
jgi:NRAMP (natural resistance-associated macrophage protein)-like metal ion transporter